MLKKHHLGIVVLSEKIESIEDNFSKKFILDTNQGTRVCIVRQPYFKLPIEYIAKEGKASNYDIGFHHVCYQLRDIQELEKFKEYIKEKKIGYRLTPLLESPTEECNHVMFFVLGELGIIEINVEKVN
jgi:hypothetical protein